jgi:hypothetical protein
MCAISGKTPDQLAQLPPETQQNLKTTAALFPDALVDSELGEIPEGGGSLKITSTIGGDWGADAPDEKQVKNSFNGIPMFITDDRSLILMLPS